MKYLKVILVLIFCTQVFAQFPISQRFPRFKAFKISGIVYPTPLTYPPVLELLAENYNDITGVWTNSGSYVNKNSRSFGTIFKGTSPYRVTMNANAGGVALAYTKAINNENVSPNLLLESGTLEILFRPHNDNAVYLFGVADTITNSSMAVLYSLTNGYMTAINYSNGTNNYTVRSRVDTSLFNSTANVWYHYIWQLDGSLVNPMRMYINNGDAKPLQKTIVTDTSNFSYNTFMNTNKATVRYGVGVNPWLADGGFDGDIALVRIYNKYLTPTEVNKLFLAVATEFDLPNKRVNENFPYTFPILF